MGWMGENHFVPLPIALYGVALLMAAIAYEVLQDRIIADQGAESLLKHAIGSDHKGKISPLLYGYAIVLVFINQWVASAAYVFVALV